MARKALWNPAFIDQAKHLALLGATDAEMATFFGVGHTTFTKWKKTQPAFVEALNSGKIVADSKVAKSLYQRAIGFSQQEVDIRVVKGQLVQTVYTKKYPPDVTAQIFFLKNRRPDLWSDRKYDDIDMEIKRTQLEREKFLLAQAIAATTETDKKDDQAEFLQVLSERLPD